MALGGNKVETNKKTNGTGVTVISTQKIWQNVKHLWWICLLFFVAYGSLLGMNVWKAYQTDQAAVKLDTYQASIQIYYPHETSEEAEAFIILGESNRVLSALNESLTAEGYQPYGQGAGDKISIQRIGSSFGTTVIAEGEARSRYMAQRFGEIMVESGEEVMGKQGGLMGDAITVPCVLRSNGSTVVFERVEDKHIGFSVMDFVSWKKIMVLGATVLLGVAVIFVVILFDKKVRAREELDTVLDLPCIAELKKKKAESRTLFAAITEALCHNEQVQRLVLVAAEKNGELPALQEALKDVPGVAVEGRESVLESAETVRVCAEADGVILVVRMNKDRLDRISQSVTNLELVSAKVLGYILTD